MVSADLNNNNTSDNNFTIHDIHSNFAQFLPNKWIEPLFIISRIKGYSGIDEYISAIIESHLEMFVDTSDTIEFEEFQDYMHNTIRGKDIPNEWCRNEEKRSEIIKQEQEQEQEHQEEKI